MDDAVLVGGFERVGDLPGDGECVTGPKWRDYTGEERTL